MKILHTSDWHIGNYPGPELNGVNLRGNDIYNCLGFMVNKARSENPDLIVVSGDIFHAAKVWADRGLNETYHAINIIRKLSDVAPVAILRGTPNHDGDEHFQMLYEVLGSDPDITILDKPDVTHIVTKNGPVNVAALPGFERGFFRAKFPGLSKEEENQVFTEELGKIVLSLKAACNPGYPSILLAHYTVPGCNTESGQVQFFSQFEPVILPEVLDAAGFDLVALGHIHRPQWVQSCRNTYYAGAINALNFNDEGQERGFWIHTLRKPVLESEFIQTPAREFITLRLADEEIASCNFGDFNLVARNHWDFPPLEAPNAIQDKIVRVLYTCTDELNKAFNKALLEKRLYDDGAFWVQEITPEKITITVNRNELSEHNSPEDNLREYLMEKAVPDDKIAALIEAARPVIDEAAAGNITASLTGLFVPVEIEVRNYRNYAEETFNFNDITFCTINGKNGAGKSSLFMDAMLDCLFEEPREGDLTGWISNGEKARSGSIKFTFKIGGRIFRVTRTRTKSGSGTLNLSEYDKTAEDNWANRSEERMPLTQAKIIDILGMDSLTFRSCALIMQDQYGLFLQADKESRMAILGNILGLGVYGEMEAIARDKAAEVNKQIRQKNDELEKLSANLPDGDDIQLKISEANTAIEDKTTQIKMFTVEADALKLRLNSKLEAAARAFKLQNDVENLRMKKTATEGTRGEQVLILDNSNIILSQEQTILDGVAKYHGLLEKEKELLSSKALFDSKLTEYGKLQTELQSTQREINSLKTELDGLMSRRAPLAAKIALTAELEVLHDTYLAEKAMLSSLEGISNDYIRLSNEIATAEKTKSSMQSQYNTEYAQRIAEYKAIKEKAAILENSGCIDQARATCRFLADAQAAKAKIEPYKEDCHKWDEDQKAKLAEAQAQLDSLNQKRDALGYDPEAIKTKRQTVAELEAKSREYEALAGYQQQINLIDERVGAINLKLSELAETAINLTCAIKEASQELEGMTVAAEQYNALQAEIAGAKSWLDKEKLLPVAREKKAIAEARILELNVELSQIESDIVAKQQELETENQTAAGSETLKADLAIIEGNLSTLQTEIQSLSMEIGGLNKQLETMKTSQAEIVRIQALVKDLADSSALYEELKKAFSQDGVPHNIIRSIVPQIEATANNILGQMSGGKMSMEFVTEKVLKSNNKKEVVTLDIIINEAGGRLPYLSKSGGERVKAALSAILALAEIKSSRAGIQLGMLFIDEPPFLDASGIQAYCDALETIQSRYKGLKIMAITHDPTMKARFPQSIDIEKTDEGSKVIYS
ncbi:MULTISPECIES: AAA family ATPase [unclassified Dehalobacter]|uniref:AAA family ATPase n=1 Tax=unclassified Dehalobacter TaxID=2635733 RepID=UPI001051BEC5|nr:MULTISPECIES: AAA family ATPase [unclassified Dehalobacter]TCX51972.1 hypothetical protein C1I36_06540 [Dehalobacter sp. 14DCB1]TCX53032.1 hypothetical protein C1I38_08220 [Dehalobacter sp. 12DCB1]